MAHERDSLLWRGLAVGNGASERCKRSARVAGMQRSGGQCGLQCNSQVKLVAHMCDSLMCSRSGCCGPSRRGSGRLTSSLYRCDKPQVTFLPYRRFLNEGEKRLCNLRRITVNKVRNASRRFESHLAEAGDGRGCRPMAGDHVQKCRVRSL